jgi:hypothetical protein
MTALLLLFVSMVSQPTFAQNAPPTNRGDNSDWWSLLREDVPRSPGKPETRSFSASNFEILGIAIREDDLFGIGDFLGRATASIGEAPKIERGDAATGRSQLCYTSSQNPGSIYLIFEGGETDLSVYLFSKGPAWAGSEHCLKTSLVAPALKTTSGLHLGQTKDQVETLLGKPTASRNNALIYWGAVKRKISPKTLQDLQRENPQMNEKEFHDNFDSYNLSAFIEARFIDSKLAYLALSKSGD